MFGQVMCQVRSHTTGNRALRAGERTDRTQKRPPSAGGAAGQGVGWANSPTLLSRDDWLSAQCVNAMKIANDGLCAAPAGLAE